MLSQAQKEWCENELGEEGINETKRGDRASQMDDTRTK
jgi:hypothetical protein